MSKKTEAAEQEDKAFSFEGLMGGTREYVDRHYTDRSSVTLDFGDNKLTAEVHRDSEKVVLRASHLDRIIVLPLFDWDTLVWNVERLWRRSEDV